MIHTVVLSNGTKVALIEGVESLTIGVTYHLRPDEQISDESQVDCFVLAIQYGSVKVYSDGGEGTQFITGQLGRMPAKTVSEAIFNETDFAFAESPSGEWGGDIKVDTPKGKRMMTCWEQAKGVISAAHVAGFGFTEMVAKLEREMNEIACGM